ncbi:MAG: ATPase [Oscillospiraceae bacterium]|jgi:V/A-type H+-transporting ATPase subunit I|nr:ATPase [Oscillospiraceae bacterium]
MAIEKMAPVSIEGPIRQINKTLVKCCESGCFQIVPPVRRFDGQNGDRRFKTLRQRNVFAPLVKRGLAIAENMGLKIRHVEHGDVEYGVSIDFSGYFAEIENRLNPLTERKGEAEKNVAEYSLALSQVEHLVGLRSNFDEIFSMKYIKVRFGRLPVESYVKLKYFEDRNFFFVPFESRGDFTWGVYFVPETEAATADDIFKSINFERIRVPDYFHGTADQTKEHMRGLISAEKEKFERADREIAEFREKEGDGFLKVFCRLKSLDESHELRSDVAVANNRFYISGFIPKREKNGFAAKIEGNGVTVQVMPRGSVSGEPPVLLRNNRFFRPFEMFVRMYGLPDYNGIDPTPFVAVSYMLIYGIMFGDLGQGLTVSLLGVLLTFWKKVKIGPIMTRIGISGAVFGTLYGSVFGMEHIIEPFFKIPKVYKFMGFEHPPRDIFGISAFLLAASLVLGIVIIVVSMLLNVFTRLKTRDYGGALLGASGLNGLILYSSVIAAAVSRLVFGKDILNVPYVTGLIVLPLAGLFFREPLDALITGAGNAIKARRINGDKNLVDMMKSFGGARGALPGKRSAAAELARCEYVQTRFGRLKYGDYKNAGDISGDDGFLFFPYGEDGFGYITGFYAAAPDSSARAERYFDALGFEPMEPPSDPGAAKERRAAKLGGERKKKERKKTVGEFIIEGVIELFENLLTYVTNTMSFLRIGGFILSHAGLMLVVGVLAEMAGGGGLLVSIAGNIFVIVVEGFIVAIQALRLEFYEMFSRFYKSGGQEFKPVMINLNLN